MKAVVDIWTTLGVKFTFYWKDFKNTSIIYSADRAVFRNISSLYVTQLPSYKTKTLDFEIAKVVIPIQHLQVMWVDLYNERR